MSDFFAWLMSAAWPIAKKILGSLGVGTLTYAGLTPLVTNVVGLSKAAFGGLFGVVLQFALLAGAAEVFGIIAGAFMARVYLYAFKRLGIISE